MKKVIKKAVKNLIRLYFQLIPYSLFMKKYDKDKLCKFKALDIYEQVCVKRFFKDSPLIKNFEECCEKAEKSNKYCLIKQGSLEYKVVNFCFVREMVANIIWCLERGYKPLIDIDSSYGNYKVKSNLWEKIYIQPFGENLEEIKSKYKDDIEICPVKLHCVFPGFQDVRDSKKIEFWNKIYKKFVVYNEFCQDYIDQEFETILKGKKCLACLIRGTDYIKIKPRLHPIQPTVDEVIEKLKQVMSEQKLEYIYLATEEKKIADMVKKEFGDVVLENKRKYFDEIYDKGDIRTVAHVNFDREDDDFWKMLEYMSSIDLLSKCDSIVAGVCGGSEAAVYFNGNKYKVMYLFDKGVY